MSTAMKMEDLKEQIDAYVKDEPDLIPILTSVGIGVNNAPTKKNKYFKVGEVQVPASALKEEYRTSVLPHGVNIKTIAFIPRHLASDELLRIVDGVEK
jgi:hypothetical protein